MKLKSKNCKFAFMNLDEIYINRCFELAINGLGNVSPNPMVGCVIVNENKIIGEGFHIKYGEPHAEVNAINSVKNKALLKDSTVYVNLEPCSHFGKTPPCADLLILHKIKKVVISNTDPNPLVKGKGIQKLKDAGIEVVENILSDKGKELNKRFFIFHTKRRPYIILKWAKTADGFIDINRENNFINNDYWITNDKLRVLVHKWRSEEQSILIGTNTALNDNPRLNVRNYSGKNPIRMVLDEHLNLPKHLHIFDETVDTIFFTAKQTENTKHIQYVKINFKENIFPQIFKYLYENNITSVIVEGGKMLLESFISNNLWDEARILTGEKVFVKGLEAPQINGKLIINQIIDGNTLQCITNQNIQ